MMPHPLVHQELPHEPHFGLYNRRLRSLEYGKVSTDELYWRLRRQVVLAHTGELATEIHGPEAEELLNLVFTRDISRVRVGRCSYQFACFPDGGMIIDGILLRLADDRFWFAQGDGEFSLWLRAHATRFDVDVRIADVWISQVQGPRSLDVLAEVSDTGLPAPFRYFDWSEIRVDGRPLVVSRTGYTNELGWEFYFHAGQDAETIGARIFDCGKAYGMHTIPATATNARRIEAGLLFSGADFDQSVNPFEVGLGKLVDLKKKDFIGKTALGQVDQGCRTWGLQCGGGVPQRGSPVMRQGQAVGQICSSAWSPFLRCGIAIARLNETAYGPGDQCNVECTDGRLRIAQLCELPMYDAAGEIPRGKRTDIPEIPEAPMG
jgi:aminomethyltransferase